MKKRRNSRRQKGRIGSQLVIVLFLVGLGWLARDSFAPLLDEAKEEGKRLVSRELESAEVVYPEAILVPSKYNDGDSFLIQHGQRQQEYRLYFVDAPESRDKPFDDHRQRVREQGAVLGGLGYKEALAVGKEAKSFTTSLLQKGHFQVYTREELVYGGPRQYAFVKVSYRGERMWLHELLVRKGLARIHTKGADLPNGTPWRAQKKKLYALQKTAQQEREGAWARRP